MKIRDVGPMSNQGNILLSKTQKKNVKEIPPFDYETKQRLNMSLQLS